MYLEARLRLFTCIDGLSFARVTADMMHELTDRRIKDKARRMLPSVLQDASSVLVERLWSERTDQRLNQRLQKQV